MKGIAGTVGPHVSADALSGVGRMLTASDADGASTVLLPHAALGPDAAVAADRQSALILDGTITNLDDIRQALVASGFRLRQQNPAEVLLAAANAWTPAVLVTRLRGVFAIAFYQGDPLRLTLMRDRFGGRRLAYYRHGGTVSFCSAIRGLREAFGGDHWELDPAAVAEFLELGWISDQRSIYKGIEKVPAGGFVTLAMGQTEVQRFWTPPRPQGRWPLGFENVCAVVEQLVLQSVQARLQTQSTVAALGGPGIESSILAWALATLDARVPFLRVAQAGEPAEDTEAAQNVARRLGVRQEVIWVSALEEPRVFELADAFDEPFAAPAAFQMLRVGKAVNRRAGVLLAGDGVDWLFLGSPAHSRCWWMERLLRDLDVNEPPVTELARNWLGLPAAYRQPGARAAKLAGARLREAMLTPVRVPRASTRLLEDYLAFDRVASFDRDRAGMHGAARYFGIEARSPFLDENIWDFVGHVPYSQRLHGGRSRAILRGLATLHAGDVFAQREKPNPVTLVRQLLASRWQPALGELLKDSHLVEGGWVDGAAIQREYSTARQRGEGSLGLWHFFVLEYWLRRVGRRRLTPAAMAATAG